MTNNNLLRRVSRSRTIKGVFAATTALVAFPAGSFACVQGPTVEGGNAFSMRWWQYTCCIGGCSGSLVRGKRVVLTAGHCIGSDAGTKSFWRCLQNEQHLGTALGSYAVVLGGWANGQNQVSDMGYNVTRTGLSSGDTMWYADQASAYNNSHNHVQLGYPAEGGWNGRTPGWCLTVGPNRYWNTPGDPRFFTNDFFLWGGMSGGPVFERWDWNYGIKQVGINNWSDRCNNAGSRRIDGEAIALLNGAPTN